MRLASSVLTLVVAASAPSQTYIVDVLGGPSASFTSIAGAVAAVPDGAVLLVRTGTYAGFAINNKGLTVLADPGVRVQGAWPFAIQIQNSSATQPVVLRNLDLDGAGIYCGPCAGPVLLDQIHFVGGSMSGAPLTVDGCSQVMATSSVFRGGALSPGVHVVSSQFVLVNSSVQGGFSYGPGIWAQGGRVQVVSSSVSANTGGASSTAIAGDAASDVRLLGNTTLTAPPGPQGYAIQGNPPVRRASTVTLTGLVQASSMVTVDNESLSGTGGALGGSVSATLNGANGNIALLVLGVTGPPLFVPGILDSWWLDSAVSASVALAVQNGPLTAAVPIPPTPALQGQLFGFQGLYLTPTGLSMSSPYRFVIQ
jgi:hypothetical protein